MTNDMETSSNNFWQAVITYRDGQVRAGVVRTSKADAERDAYILSRLGCIAKTRVIGTREAKVSLVYSKLGGVVERLTV